MRTYAIAQSHVKDNRTSLGYCTEVCEDEGMETNSAEARACYCGTCDYCAFKLQMLWERDPWPGYISHYTPPKREGGGKP